MVPRTDMGGYGISHSFKYGDETDIYLITLFDEIDQKY